MQSCNSRERIRDIDGDEVDEADSTEDSRVGKLYLINLTTIAMTSEPTPRDECDDKRK